MAIKFERSLKNQNFPAVVKMPTKASTQYYVGMALTIVGGVLTPSTGATKPTFISCTEYLAPASGMEDITVEPVLETSIYLASKNDGDFSATAVGTKLTLHTDSMSVTPTTTSGVFTVDEVLANNIRGRFE